jgi:predicted nuclease with TOPRIM domain
MNTTTDWLALIIAIVAIGLPIVNYWFNKSRQNEFKQVTDKIESVANGYAELTKDIKEVNEKLTREIKEINYELKQSFKDSNNEFKEVMVKLNTTYTEVYNIKTQYKFMLEKIETLQTVYERLENDIVKLQQHAMHCPIRER